MRYSPTIRVALLVALALGATASIGFAKEARGVWLSASYAAKCGETADQIADRLAQCGFNMVFASYEPNSQPLRALLSACRQRHIETHLWLFRPPVELKDAWHCRSYDVGKHAMVPGRGCLCDEEYLAACEEKVRQIVREYDVDGVQFDEVGYGQPWESLCERCGKAFAADTHKEVKDWPNDVIRVGQLTGKNSFEFDQWGGPQFEAFVQWRCERLAKYLKRLADAARSVRPLTISYAAMSEPSADRVFYGEDLAELAKSFDFIAPMSYYTQYSGMSGGRPEWTAEVCKTLGDWIHQGNPRCQVYAGISAYGADGGWAEPVRALYDKLVASGAITADQRKEHLKCTTCKQGFDSLEWLHTEGRITPEEYDRAKAALDARTPTADEMVRAVQAIRKAGLPGMIFFRYECMFEDRVQGVIGQDLWPRLQAEFAEGK